MGVLHTNYRGRSRPRGVRKWELEQDGPCVTGEPAMGPPVMEFEREDVQKILDDNPYRRATLE